MHPPAEALSLGEVALKLAAVLALVLANAFFVASEFALVSVRRTRIDQLAAEGSGSAVVVQRALGDLDRYIAATQVGITIASLLLGGIGESTLEPLIEEAFKFFNVPANVVGVARSGIALFLAYFIMTALHVIIGELMPKSVALQRSEATCLVIGRPMTLCARLFTPLIWMLNGTGNFLLRRLGLHATEGHEQVHSPGELDLLFKHSHEGGELNRTEFEILHRVVRFSDLTAREVMVPRVEMKALSLEMARADLLEYLHNQPHSRIPIYQGSMDEIRGVVHIKDLVRFEAGLRNNGDTDSATVDLTPLLREAPRVPETMTIDRLLLEFKRRRQQMAIVIDEYGGTSGLITMGDLLEQVFGDVHDEFDKPEQEIAEQGDGQILLVGRVLIDEVNDRYHLGFRADEADTIAGLVLSALGRPAVVGDEVTVNGARLRVTAIERLRITEILLKLPALDRE